MKADQAIKNRKTAKVLADTVWPISTDKQKLEVILNELLDLAATAPFHYPCNVSYTKNELNSSVPWRFYVLDTANCRDLHKYIDHKKINAGKISNMLGAADALLIVTWLPEPNNDLTNSEETVLYNGNIKNMEHIAACSAAIQNVLLGATARNIPNYWSSGGMLRDKELSTFLQISYHEIMLGALFLFPEDSEKRNATIKPGALRHKGKEKNTWSKWIDINSLNK